MNENWTKSYFHQCFVYFVRIIWGARLGKGVPQMQHHMPTTPKWHVRRVCPAEFRGRGWACSYVCASYSHCSSFIDPAVALTIAPGCHQIHAAQAALARESGLLDVFWKDCGMKAPTSFFVVEILRSQICVSEHFNLCGWVSFTFLTKWARLTSC
jgi:hypothetical protein